MSEPRARAFANVRNIAQIHGHAVAFDDQDILHLRYRAKQAQAADVDALLAHGQIIAADIRVARLHGGNDLRQGHIVLKQFLRIDFSDVLASAPAERCDVDNSRYLLDFALDEPIFRGL